MLDIVSDLFACRIVEFGDHYRGPLFGEPVSDASTNSLTGAGYYGDFAIESAHCASSLIVSAASTKRLRSTPRPSISSSTSWPIAG